MDAGEVSWRRPPLVSSAWELRCFGRTWAAVAVAAAVGVVLAGGAADLTGLELWACALLFFLTVAGALARAFLGLRTQPDMEYARIFDRSPAPPAGLRLEAGRSTASRAAWAAAGIAALLVVGAAAALIVMFILMGEPREHVLDHLAGAAGLLAAGWTFVCALASFRIAVWFRRWEARRGRTVLCRPLTSGRLGYVYYVEGAESRR
ncbi:MAG TPA: hypothetical protein VGN71_03160 [Solirubrobacteraceae bacterium]|jgi:hypothetical protein|nr:hypothetical protein [Solirubrobacteraceae bacterium]